MRTASSRETPALGTRWSAVTLGTRWSAATRRVVAALTATLVTLAIAATPGFNQAQEASGRLVSVIVRELPGSGGAPERLVETLGGSVTRHIGIIDAFVADVPSGGIARLERMRAVHSVTRNRPVQMLHAPGGVHTVGEADSLHGTASTIGATELYELGITGDGVDVALIDTGVVPVDGLTYPDKVINGPDLSFESQVDELRYLDTYGHGTHMAGIIAGRDDAAATISEADHANHLGIAPGSRLVSVKVANALGVTDVSQVLAAIDWVVQHRNHDGLNIRVLNISFGTDGAQSYLVDPLTYAVEVAWRKGIVVVAAAGNHGYGPRGMNNPAYNPHIIAVGANDTQGTNRTNDDEIPDFSARGSNERNPDVVAPGRSIVSLRAPGSFIDELNPDGRVDDRFFKGSGTSQSAAVVSGAAALLLEQRPDLTPDQVKHLLRETATTLPAADEAAQGDGLVNLKAAAAAPTPDPSAAAQPFPYGDGSGSLDLARGSAIVQDEEGNELTGEQNIFGDPWDGRSWSELSWDGRSWSGGDWLGRSWSGRSWSGRSWSGAEWTGRSWSGRSWSTENWTGRSWSGRSWSGESWLGRSWSGRSWSGRSWSDDTWSGRSWSSVMWS